MSGVLDLETTHDEVASAIRGLTQGLSVLRLQVSPDHGLFLSGLLGKGDRLGAAREIKAADVNMLSLLTQGFSNREIGRSLRLSPHTVKHYLEHLREVIGARNRVELAAWAARQMMEHDPNYAGAHYAVALAAQHNGDASTARAEAAAAARLWSKADADLAELKIVRGIR